MTCKCGARTYEAHLKKDCPAHTYKGPGGFFVRKP